METNRRDGTGNGIEGRRRGGRRRLGVGASACLALGFAALALAARAQDGAGLEDARATLEKYVETRRVLSDERRDWTLGREMLGERIELVEREIEAQRARIAQAEASIAEADTQRAGLVEENTRLRASSAGLEVTVIELEARTRELVQRLPEPIAERVKPLSQRLPADPGVTKLSLSERFQNVVGILNEVNKFNREITATSEVRALPDGTSAEVTTLYVGIGQAWYAGASGDVAGVGGSSGQGWTWTPASASAAEIRAAIAILKNEQVASFVKLPLHVK